MTVTSGAPGAARPAWLPSLRVAILSSGDARISALASSLEQRLAGGPESVAGGEMLPPSGEALAERFELRVFARAPAADAGPWLDQALHSVLVVLVDARLFTDTALLDWLRAAALHLRQPTRRHSLLAVPLSDELNERWQSETETLGRYQSLPWYGLGEAAERADMLALRVLNHMVRVLATTVFTTPDWKLRVFLSHAKQDGLYLAQSIRYFIATQGWLDKFYDAEDIEPGWSWEEQLRQGVGRSLVLVLRTDAYDRRFWCRSEVRWAEALCIPVVVVDARSGLVYPASDLPFDGVQTVRVPDGNLPRILFSVLQTVLQSMLFQRSVRQLREHARLPPSEAAVRVLGVTPGIPAIVHACEELRSAPHRLRLLVYPDPPLREGVLQAAQALAAAVKARLTTPRQRREETD
jgi:hypothetical protein